MTKIDKTDLQNLKLIVKETNLNGISKIKIKKNNYEIEICGNNFSNENLFGTFTSFVMLCGLCS